jgi:hypothetical protein
MADESDDKKPFTTFDIISTGTGKFGYAENIPIPTIEGITIYDLPDQPLPTFERINFVDGKATRRFTMQRAAIEPTRIFSRSVISRLTWGSPPNCYCPWCYTKIAWVMRSRGSKKPCPRCANVIPLDFFRAFLDSF